MEDKFILRSKVYFNKDDARNSMEFLKTIKGSCAFIVSDEVMKKLGYLQKTTDNLNEAGISSIVFTDVKPNPDTKVVAAGMKAYMESNPDILIALGGGSTIDSAKGILYSAKCFLENTCGKFVKPLFIAIPSTSGTGSEVTNFSVITVEDEKICIIDELIAPDIAILDSTCVKHVPKHVLADTCIDVLVHSVEAYVSVKANDFTDALAEKSIKLVFENIRELYKNPEDACARDHILNASCMAGMAFTNSNLGITHSLAHALGGMFHISHGRSNALLVTKVIEYNSDLFCGANNYATKKYAKLAKALNLPARTCREGTVNLIDAIKELRMALEIEDRIKALKIDEDIFENALGQMSDTALMDRCTTTNPKQPTKEDIINIYKKAY